MAVVDVARTQYLVRLTRAKPRISGLALALALAFPHTSLVVGLSPNKK